MRWQFIVMLMMLIPHNSDSLRALAASSHQITIPTIQKQFILFSTVESDERHADLNMNT